MDAQLTHSKDQLPLLIVKNMHLALQRMEMYGEDHAVSKKAMKETFSLIRELFNYAPSFTLSVSRDELLFDRVPMEQTYFTQRFVQDFNELGIFSITFNKKLKFEEFVNFLRFLVREPGKTKEKKDLEEYLKKLGIDNILVDRIKYVAVTGDVDETEQQKKILTEILAKHADVIEKLLSSEYGETDEEVMTPLSRAIEMGDEYDVAEILAAIVRREGLMDKSEEELSETERELLEIIRTVQENLSEEAKKLFLEKVSQIADEVTMEVDEAQELLAQDFTLTEVSLLNTAEDTFKRALEEGWSERLQYDFAGTVERIIQTGNPKLVEKLVDTLIGYFEEHGAVWATEAFKTLIETAFNVGDDAATGFLLEELLEQKESAEPSEPVAKVLTAALVFFASLLIISRKFSAVLRIYREYEKRAREEMSFEALSDFETFIQGLSSPETLRRLFASLGRRALSVDLELKGIIEKLDGETVTRIIIEQLGTQSGDFTTIAAQLLEPHRDIAKQVIEEYIKNMGRLNRSDKGYIIDSEQLRRTINVFRLGIKLDKEWMLPLLLMATNDRDVRIKKQIFFFLMIYPPERIESAIEALFLEANPELRREIVEEIARRPNPVKDYYLRQILLFFPQVRRFIIDVLSEVRTPYAKQILLELLGNWVIYVDSLPKNEIKPFLINLVRSLRPFADDPDVRRALKTFRHEWKSEGVYRESSSIFFFKKDEVMQAVDEVLEG